MSRIEQKKEWEMPDWMEKYRSFISLGNETKGSTTSVEDLMNDTTTSPFNNSIRWAMILVIQTKVQTLEYLKKEGWLHK